MKKRRDIKTYFYKMFYVGIIGNGFVGKATRLFSCHDVTVISYDTNPSLCQPPGTQLTDLLTCHVIFICVPTPMNPDGSCYTKIVRTVIGQLRDLSYAGYIICRSTVPIGTCDELGCYFMPEFLTEAKYIQDFITTSTWIIGMPDADKNTNKNEEFSRLMTRIIGAAYECTAIKSKHIVFVSNQEAETIKLFRNCYLATKVSFCNEMYELCDKKGIDYNTVARISCSDARIGTSHSNVPGPDGKYGFGGTCFPKDMASLLYEMNKADMKSYIIDAAVKRNTEKDRVEHDWTENKGRSVVNL